MNYQNIITVFIIFYCQTEDKNEILSNQKI